MAWIDFKKAYDIVPQNWMLRNRKMQKIFGQILQFIKKTMYLVSGIDSRR